MDHAGVAGSWRKHTTTLLIHHTTRLNSQPRVQLVQCLFTHYTCACPAPLQVRELRRELDVHVSGFDAPRPVKTFGQAGFDHLLLGAIKKAGYEAPTAIQAQALPAALSGRDVLVRVGGLEGWEA